MIVKTPTQPQFVDILCFSLAQNVLQDTHEIVIQVQSYVSGNGDISISCGLYE